MLGKSACQLGSSLWRIKDPSETKQPIDCPIHWLLKPWTVRRLSFIKNHLFWTKKSLNSPTIEKPTKPEKNIDIISYPNKTSLVTCFTKRNNIKITWSLTLNNLHSVASGSSQIGARELQRGYLANHDELNHDDCSSEVPLSSPGCWAPCPSWGPLEPTRK